MLSGGFLYALSGRKSCPQWSMVAFCWCFFACVEHCSLRITPYETQKRGVVLSRLLCVGVGWSQSLFADGESTSIQGFGLLILLLMLVEFCQSMKRISCARMLGSQVLLVDRESSLIQGFCLLALPLVHIKECQVIQAPSCVWMLGSQVLLTDRECSLIQGF